MTEEDELKVSRREEAVRCVDARNGCAIEFAWDPSAHQQEYDEEEQRLTEEGWLP